MDFASSTSSGMYYVQLMGQDQGPYDPATLQSMVRAGTVRADTMLR